MTCSTRTHTQVAKLAPVPEYPLWYPYPCFNMAWYPYSYPSPFHCTRVPIVVPVPVLVSTWLGTRTRTHCGTRTRTCTRFNMAWYPYSYPFHCTHTRTRVPTVVPVPISTCPGTRTRTHTHFIIPVPVSRYLFWYPYPYLVPDYNSASCTANNYKCGVYSTTIHFFGSTTALLTKQT